MGDSLFKKLVNDTVSTIEDLFIASLAVILIVFVAGQFFGVKYAGTPVFWYPIWAFIIVLLLKLLKDAFFQMTKPKEKKEDS